MSKSAWYAVAGEGARFRVETCWEWYKVQVASSVWRVGFGTRLGGLWFQRMVRVSVWVGVHVVRRCGFTGCLWVLGDPSDLF